MKFERKYLKKVSSMKYKILSRMYFGNAITRKLFSVYIDKFEGGQLYSTTLRKIFKEKYDIEVGISSYGCFTTNIRPHVKVGSYCSFAPGVQRLVGNHPYQYASSHPLFYKKEFGALDETRYEERYLNVGNDVWIGVNAIITGNVKKIGDGAVIGAGAVVTHDVPPYAIVAGVPAKQISERFSEEIQNKLLKSEWWLLYPDELKDIAQYADDVECFITKVEEIKENKRKK